MFDGQNKRNRRGRKDKTVLLSFLALYGMTAPTSDEKGVCLSVRLSVKRVHCDKTEERSVHILYRTKII